LSETRDKILVLDGGTNRGYFNDKAEYRQAENGPVFKNTFLKTTFSLSLHSAVFKAILTSLLKR
jgi:hypothetical protein